MIDNGDDGVVLRTSEYANLLHWCYKAVPEEACGLILDWFGPAELTLVSTGNMADKPLHNFQIDQDAQKANAKRMRGLWHSHPTGEARPSDVDRLAWLEEGWWYIVVGMMTGQPRLGVYRVEGGKLVRRHLTITWAR